MRSGKQTYSCSAISDVWATLYQLVSLKKYKDSKEYILSTFIRILGTEDKDVTL